MEYLVISAIGPNNPNAVSELLLLAAKNDCSIEKSRLTVMGSDMALAILVSGNWNTIAKVETGIVGLKKDLSITTRRTKSFTPPGEDLLPYLVQIIAINQPSLVYEITNFFVQHTIFIDDLQTSIFPSSFGNTNMISVHMRIGVPGDISLADFRETFTLLCDELNMDGVLEPEKH